MPHAAAFAEDVKIEKASEAGEGSSLSLLIGRAVEAHPSIAAALASARAAGADVRAAKWQRFPSFSVEGLLVDQPGNATQAQAVVDQPLWTGGRISGSITGDELIVEAKVSPSDIAYVRLGQEASVKFDSYDSSIFGSAVGKISYISPDTLVEQRPAGEQLYYQVHIRVDTRAMHPHGKDVVEIQPGMTATSEILTGHNTVLKYLLKPIIKTLEESFGER